MVYFGIFCEKCCILIFKYVDGPDGDPIADFPIDLVLSDEQGHLICAPMAMEILDTHLIYSIFGHSVRDGAF